LAANNLVGRIAVILYFVQCIAKNKFIMFAYDVQQLKPLVVAVIEKNTSADAFYWLKEKAGRINEDKNAYQFNLSFAAIPRKTGKAVINISGEELMRINSIRPGFTISNWTIDRLSRVWLLLRMDPSDKQHYLKAIDNLFLTAEMNELVALYSSLPLLAYPQSWKMRCAEGIRSNIGTVLEAIMCNNPYPSENLDEPAWNQLVLKAFFTEKPVHLIVGLDQRCNEPLAKILIDYAHERWAAHRPVNPQLWRCVGKYIDESIMPDIERLLHSDNEEEQRAAALACADSNFTPAKKLFEQSPYRAMVQSGELTWNKLAEKIQPVS
jgi:hypothetical protein